MPDTGLITFLLGWSAVAGTFTLILLRKYEFYISRPVLSIANIVRSGDALDVSVRNAGSGVAVGIRIGLRGGFDGVRIFRLDALGDGAEVELKSLCPRSDWVEL